MKDRMRRWDKLDVMLVEKVFVDNIWACLSSLKKLFLKFWVSKQKWKDDQSCISNLMISFILKNVRQPSLEI